MNTQEIIAELPKLKRQELSELDAKLHELLEAVPQKVWNELLEIAGTGEGLPADYAKQHDEDLHGVPKKYGRSSSTWSISLCC